MELETFRDFRASMLIVAFRLKYRFMGLVLYTQSDSADRVVRYRVFKELSVFHFSSLFCLAW